MPRPSFHKLIYSSTIQERRLRIPDNFVKKFKDELSIAVALTLPDGHVWRVGLRRTEDKIWFQDGWSEFVDRYSIRIGYLLVFRYEAVSAFSVFIFNLPSSEIMYESFGLGGGSMDPHNNHYRRNRIFDELEDDDFDLFGSCSSSISPGPTTLTLVKSGSTIQDLFSGCKDDEELPKAKKSGKKKRKIEPLNYSLPNPSAESNIFTPPFRTVNADDEQAPSPQLDMDSDKRFKFYKSASARKRTALTAEERERAINASKAFEPINPFCRVVLRPSYLYRGCIMYLPSCFAEKHLSGISGFIKLQITDAKQWPVRCVYKGGKAKLSQGWYEFTVENNIGEGDVCVFELLKAREFVLKVTVFRVREDI